MTDEYRKDDQDEDARRALTNAARDIRAAIDRAVTRYATATGHELQNRPAWPGGISTYQFADPATGIHAATIARNSADRVRDDYVRRARQDGMSWLAIGQALGLDQGRDAQAGYDLAVTAFETVAGEPDIYRQPTLGWRCPSCDATVSDHGPYEGHPEDNERGHADGCQRLADDVAAHHRRMAEWDVDMEAE
jgi:hypothetical protein